MSIAIQFAKFPKLGHVKTRLEPRLQKTGSYELHLKLVSHVHDTLKESNCQSYLFLDQYGDHPKINALKTQTEIELQQGNDLGEKMLNALNWGLTKSDKTLIVGSDCPVIDPNVIQTALNALDHNEMVFVPAEDGGYVLVGAKTINPNVFTDMPWGTDQVMEKTIKKLEQDGSSFALLDTLWDVDRPEDYDRLVAWDDRFKVL